jgi:hypothetical protein
MLFFLLLFGCKKVCDDELLLIASNKEDVLSACEIDGSTDKTISCTASYSLDEDGYDSRKELYKKCALNELIDEESFALAKGEPVQAAKIYDWMRQNEVPEAKKHALLFIEQSPFANQIEFTRIQQVEGPQPSQIQYLDTNITSGGMYGVYPDWHVPMEVNGPVAFEKQINMRTLRHVVASVATPQTPLEVVFLSNHLVTVPIYAPSNEEIPYYSSELKEVPTAKRVRINLADEDTMETLAQYLEKLSDKEVELAIDHSPCFTPPNGMQCQPMGKRNIYIDKAPITQEQAKGCTSRKGCKSSKGTWQRSTELCSYLGKRLPTVDEFKAAGITDVVWSRNRDSRSFKKRSCADGVKECPYSSKHLLSNGTIQHDSKKIAELPYCASDNHILSNTAPYVTADQYPEPPPLVANPKLAEIANSVQHDRLEDKGICGQKVRDLWQENLRNGGRADLSCRDPYSYVTSNEPYRYVWEHHLKNVGGGYVGVGSDQNYDFIATAKSEWAWVYDYDPNIYRLHKLIRPLIMKSENPKEFISYFDKSRSEEIYDLLKSEYTEKEAQEYISLFYSYYRRMAKAYKRGLNAYPIKEFGWLSNQDKFEYIRTMYQQDRIIIVKGDLMGDKAFSSIGKIARKMNLPIRIFYVSNAPLAWGSIITPSYSANVAALPYDDTSLFLSTYGGGGGFMQRRYWLYITANAKEIRDRIIGHYSSSRLMWDKRKGPEPDLYTVALPSKRRRVPAVEFRLVD